MYTLVAYGKLIEIDFKDRFKVLAQLKSESETKKSQSNTKEMQDGSAQ